MATVTIKCKECGQYAERGIGGTGAEFCGLNCKARDFRRRRKAQLDGFRAAISDLAAAGDWDDLSHVLVADPRARLLSARELYAWADRVSEALGNTDTVLMPGIGWAIPSPSTRARLAELAATD